MIVSQMQSESFQSFSLSCNALNLTFVTMENSIHLKYLVISPTDLKWGITINSVGFQNIAAHTSYPPNNHPSRYLFSTDNGRVLNEYQLLYITRGGGNSHPAPWVVDATSPSAKAICSYSFPANGTTTCPTAKPDGMNIGSDSKVATSTIGQQTVSSRAKSRSTT